MYNYGQKTHSDHMLFQDIKIEGLKAEVVQVQIKGQILTISIIPRKEFADEAPKLSAITFSGLPEGTMLGDITFSVTRNIPSDIPGMYKLLFEMYVGTHPKFTFESLPISHRLHDTLLGED